MQPWGRRLLLRPSAPRDIHTWPAPALCLAWIDLQRWCWFTATGLHIDSEAKELTVTAMGTSGNKISSIENTGATENQFDCIDLSDNDVVRLEGFSRLPRLRTLLLNNNRIARIGEGLGGTPSPAHAPGTTPLASRTGGRVPARAAKCGYRTRSVTYRTHRALASARPSPTSWRDRNPDERDGGRFAEAIPKLETLVLTGNRLTNLAVSARFLAPVPATRRRYRRPNPEVPDSAEGGLRGCCAPA